MIRRVRELRSTYGNRIGDRTMSSKGTMDTVWFLYPSEKSVVSVKRRDIP